MKRELLENTKVLPYTVSEVLDCDGFLSAVLGVKAAANGDLKITVSHCDTSTGTFTDVEIGSDTATGLKANEIANFDIDLAGCKQFVKIAVSGSAYTSGGSTCAIALGDKSEQPI